MYLFFVAIVYLLSCFFVGITLSTLFLLLYLVFTGVLYAAFIVVDKKNATFADALTINNWFVIFSMILSVLLFFLIVAILGNAKADSFVDLGRSTNIKVAFYAITAFVFFFLIIKYEMGFPYWKCAVAALVYELIVMAVCFLIAIVTTHLLIQTPMSGGTTWILKRITIENAKTVHADKAVYYLNKMGVRDNAAKNEIMKIYSQLE